MIPKIIHYCWFGDAPYSELIQKCICSWKEKLPDYEIKIWNAENFDVDLYRYTREAFQAKKYAFVSDYVRLYALYHEGGIYLDSDVEVLRSFDDLLGEKAFTGFDSSHAITTWVFGSEKGNPLFREFLEYYDDKSFFLADGTYDFTPNPVPITMICKRHGLLLNGKEQKLDHISIYPYDFFAPYDRAREIFNITERTYCIHYHNWSWIPEEKKEMVRRRRKIIKKYGKCAGYLYYGINLLRVRGFREFWKEFKFLFGK